MIGHQFDELWVYTKALSDITDRQSDLSKGFSKELIYNIAKSLGYQIEPLNVNTSGTSAM